MSHQDNNLKVTSAALKQLLVTFHSVTFRYPAVQVNLHHKNKVSGNLFVSTVIRWLCVFSEKAFNLKFVWLEALVLCWFLQLYWDLVGNNIAVKKLIFLSNDDYLL